jgi:hypothetical protein
MEIKMTRMRTRMIGGRRSMMIKMRRRGRRSRDGQ